MKVSRSNAGTKAEWSTQEMVEVLKDSPILLEAADDIKVPSVLVPRFPVSRELLSEIYGGEVYA